MRSDARRVGHTEGKEKKKKGNKGHSALWEAEAKQRVIRPFWCEFQREQNTEKRELQLKRCSPKR